MGTKIYKSYADFLIREDKTINGVSEDFAAKHPDYEESNKTNIGCWNCYNCKSCFNCSNCYACYWCQNCELCTSCKSYDYCSDCKSCTSLYGCHSAKNR